MRKPKETLTLLLAGLAALVAAAAAAAATVVVAPGQTDGWTAVNDTCGAATTGSVSFVTGPGSPPAGSGSLQYTVGSNGESYPTVRTGNVNGVRLSNLTSLELHVREPLRLGQSGTVHRPLRRQRQQRDA
jgi:opacity protein-like surface antigen